MPCPKLPSYAFYRLGPGPNERVTVSQPNQCRSESVVGINPINPKNLICASKKFIVPSQYTFTISTSHSFDGGATWTEVPLPLPSGWNGMTDPDLTFDAFGNAYLIVEGDLFPGGGNVTGIGMFVHKSTDGGKTWGAPVTLHLDPADDKQWIDSDTVPGSPYYGSVYAIWGANTNLRFARSADHGVTWKGVGGMPSGSDVTFESVFAPSLCIGPGGVIHISWHMPGTSEIRYIRSTDGGQTFSTPVSVVTGMTSLSGSLPSTIGSVSHGAWPHFPNATFRVLTLVTSCVAAGNRVILAWADNREGVTRIYYRIGENGGLYWAPAQMSGQPLLPAYPGSDLYHFHPQLSVAGDQAVGCALYEFGLKEGTYAIDVLSTFSCDDGASFHDPVTVTDHPWNPAIDAPFSHGDPNVTFIGEYFGFDASSNWFATVWTDTRTGVQELYYDGVTLGRAFIRPNVPAEVAEIIAGVVQDGGGLVFVGGKIIRIPPWDPWIDVLNALVAIDSVSAIRNPAAAQAIAALRQVIASVAGAGRTSGPGFGA